MSNMTLIVVGFFFVLFPTEKIMLSLLRLSLKRSQMHQFPMGKVKASNL